jgi:hypothetical protein
MQESEELLTNWRVNLNISEQMHQVRFSRPCARRALVHPNKIRHFAAPHSAFTSDCTRMSLPDASHFPSRPNLHSHHIYTSQSCIVSHPCRIWTALPEGVRFSRPELTFLGFQSAGCWPSCPTYRPANPVIVGRTSRNVQQCRRGALHRWRKTPRSQRSPQGTSSNDPTPKRRQRTPKCPTMSTE